jgi:hypothetical protein
MLFCIKNQKKKYKGNEPSPKGLGYCAHCEEIGTIKNGLDGNLWIVVKNNKNIKRWIIHKKILNKNNFYYKKIKDKYIGYKTYFTHFNGGRPYLIYIKNKDVAIYNVPENFTIDESSYNSNDIKWMYINLVKKYKASKIFIGKSPLISMTKFSKGYGSKFDGNTILLLVNNNYIYIKDNIEKLKINDEIIKYYSFIGNNDVPYPMAIGKKNIYFFEYQKGYLPIIEFQKFKTKKDLQNIFDKGIELSPFFKSFNKKNIKKYIISLEDFKKIKNKTLNEITLDEMKKLAKIYHVTTSGTKKELADRIEQLRNIIVYKK